MGTAANIEGLDDLLNKLREVADPQAYHDAIEKSCRIVEFAAKQNCSGLFTNPTGTLRGSITHEVVEEGNQIAGYVGTNIEYAPYVEFGTGKFAENGRGTPWSYTNERTGKTVWMNGSRPKPYLRPALEDRRERVRQILVAAINSATGTRKKNGGVKE